MNEGSESTRRDARGDRADGSVRAPIERVSAALCAAAGISPTDGDSTTRALVAAVVGEYHKSVGSVDGLDFDPETEEFRSADGDIRLEIDRFPIDAERWEALVGLVALLGLVGLGAAHVGVGESAAWVGIVALGLVATGAAVRGAVRADVSVADPSDD